MRHADALPAQRDARVGASSRRPRCVSNQHAGGDAACATQCDSTSGHANSRRRATRAIRADGGVFATAAAEAAPPQRLGRTHATPTAAKSGCPVGKQGRRTSAASRDRQEQIARRLHREDLGDLWSRRWPERRSVTKFQTPILGGPNCSRRCEVCSGVGLRASPSSWTHPNSRRRIRCPTCTGR